MPLLKIHTSTQVDKPDELISQASKTVAEMLGKPESYVMVILHPATAMSFAGSSEACAYMELKSLGLPENRTAEFSATLCQLLESRLAIPANRIYLEFAGPERHLWGWDNRTF